MGNSQASAAAASTAGAAQPRQYQADVPLTPVDLTAISLTPGSRLYQAQLLNARYVLSLDVDRLLYSFRVTAGVDTRGAQPYGGWEAPEYVCHGHFVGHALMAYAWLSQQLKATQPDMAAACLTKSNAMVAGFAECQKVYNSQPFGYFGSVGSDTFDRLEALADEALQDAPYYLVHKNMAGLLAAHRYTANSAALTVASSLADYFAYRTSRLSPQTIDAMLNTRRYTGAVSAFFMEHGGILDGCIELYRLTQEPSHLTLLHRFDRPWFRAMLADGVDHLADNGEHANAELQPVTGLANLYTLTHDATYRTAVLNFLTWMRDGHEFVNGNVSGRSAYYQPLDYGSELFNSPRLLSRQVNSTPGHLPLDNYPGAGPGSSESCCAHNLNKTTVYAVSWTRDARWGDEYEKRFVNCVLGQQHPTTGMLIYNENLHQGAQKGWGSPEFSFWCCYASGVEAFASLTNGALFTDGDTGLWLCNYFACTFDWTAQGVRVRVDTDFPASGAVKLTLSVDKATRLALHVRIPYWAVLPVSLRVNGVEESVAKAPGTFAEVDRQWVNGDVLELALPFSLYSEPLPDAPQYVGVKYGPHALVACAASGSTFDGTAAQLLASMKPTLTTPCTFTTTLQGPGAPRAVVYRPISSIVDEVYNGYTLVTRTPAEVRLDEVDVGDAVSEAAHGLTSDSSTTGVSDNLRWRNATDNGYVAYRLAVHPSKAMYMVLLFDGDEAGDEYSERVFDVQVLRPDGSWQTMATQSLDREVPNGWYRVVYPIPPPLTLAVSSITVRLQGKGFNGKSSVVGPLYDQITTHYRAEP